ncbi:4739_t:CDS:2 [Ambispora leptoticha]|uniref:4739_t:CDS:1 n=1 Tax=Ambispora leptoticha TaxID=144679 RepID=A0A9N9CL85_9GLOM|nr:4739_t:CDS:2 [Ambispora leptoticha]
MEGFSYSLAFPPERKDSSINSSTPLLSPNSSSIKSDHAASSLRWKILFGFSLLSFSSACLWITFAPCLFIFMSHYGHITPSYINSLSTIYMFIYPFLLLPSIKIFDIYGLRYGVLLGAFLNAFGAMLRFLGAFGPSGFWCLFMGQAFAAAANVFIIGVPPKLANLWFQIGEQNIAISVGVVANNAGIAAGFILSPYMIKEETAKSDIPEYMLLQFGACVLIYAFLVLTFKSLPTNTTNSRDDMPSKNSIVIEEERRPHQIRITSSSTIKIYLTNLPFLLLSISFGIIIGAQYAVSTLLAQMVVPVFSTFDESQVGLLGFLIVIAGIIGALLIGFYLDYSFAYRNSCRFLYISATISLALFNVGLGFQSLKLVFLGSICFGIFTFAITPAVFQFVTTIKLSDNQIKDEITTTGILNSVVQVWGIILVAVMDAMENYNEKFTMRIANWGLFMVLIIGIWLLWLVEGENEDHDTGTDEANHA